MTLYLRQVDVIVGSSTQAIKISYDPTDEGLEMKLTIKKSRIAYPNTAEIDIVNLAPKTIGLIQDEFTNVIVNAGYRGQVAQVFVGQIKNLEHKIDGTETITKIFAADGDVDWQKSTVNTTFKGSLSLEQQVRQLVKTFDSEITIGTLRGLDQPLVSDAPATISGSTKDQLDNLAETYNFDWSIQDQKFETVTSGDGINLSTQAIVVSAASGMIGSPTVTEIGVNVKTFFNNQLLPNRWIKVEAKGADVQLGDPTFRPTTRQDTATGNFLINSVTHYVETRGNDATSTIEARRQGVL